MTKTDKQALLIPERKKRNWSQAVMHDCDFCSQWSLTVKHDDGGCICASCCDSEYTTALMCTLVIAIDRVESAEKRIAELESSVIAPGIMRCAKCQFVLTKNNINMAAGTITAGDSKTEPCPNGCGPLWPVTWKEQALEMRDSSEQWFEDLQVANKRIAELEARTLTVKLPQGYVIRPGHPINESKRGVMIPKDGGEWLYRIAVEIAIRAAGIALDTGE